VPADFAPRSLRLIEKADHGEKEDNTDDCGEEDCTSKARAEGGFGGWGAGGRAAGAGDEAAVHLSRTSRNHRTNRLVPLRTIHRFALPRQDHPHLGRQ